jgi:replicative DNA helicase
MNTSLTSPGTYDEVSLVGSLLMDNRFISPVSEILDASDFEDLGVGAVYAAVYKLWSDGQESIDVPLVSSNNPECSEVARDCFETVGTALNALNYASKIKDASTRRQIVSQCTQITDMAKNDSRDVPELIGDAQQRIYDVTVKEQDVCLTEEVVKLYAASEDAATREGLIGLPTGFSTIDSLTGGMERGDLWVTAARPSVGKTAIMGNTILHLLENTNAGIAWFSAEMSRKACLTRMISDVSGIDSNRLKRGNLRKSEWVMYTEASAHVTELVKDRLLLDDRSAPTPGYIRGRVKQRQCVADVDLVAIDYLQIMGAPGQWSGNEVGRLNYLTAACKNMAKDIDVTVSLLCQIGRGSEGREVMNRPGITDLKGSGSTEQDADVIQIVHREYRDSPKGELLLAKQRNGPLGMVKVDYNGGLCRFTEDG